MDGQFEIVGMLEPNVEVAVIREKQKDERPWLSILFLFAIITACFACNFIMTKDPSYMDLLHYSVAPNKEFLFGTDTMGRDIFSMIWAGGRISLLIGFLSTFLSTIIAIIFGAVSGTGPKWLDSCMMRVTEICLSIPNLLLIVFIQAILGKPNILSISFVIGITSWASIAKIVRTEVRQIKSSEYVIASKAMGGSFFHVLWNHLAPNFASSIMFMVVMNIRSAIVAESTLSFMGIGLPLEMISWGSMLSLANKALMTKAWWIIMIPGCFLVITLMCMTNIGNYFRKSVNQKQSNL